MKDEYSGMRELGAIYGVSSHVIGKWLKELQLRTDSGTPSSNAFKRGFVARRPSRGDDKYYYVWHTQKTTDILDKAGHCRLRGSEERLSGQEDTSTAT